MNEVKSVSLPDAMTRARPLVFLMTQLPAARNPLIRMYVEALRPAFRVMLASRDPDEAAEVFEGVDCQGVTPPGGFRRLVHPAVRRILWKAHMPSADTFAEARSQEFGLRAGRFDYWLVANTTRRALALAWNCRKLERPALMIVVDGEMLPVARVLKVLRRTPYVYASYEIYPNQYPWYPKKLSRTLALMERHGANEATKVLVVHSSWAKLLRRRYHLDPGKFEVVSICPPPLELTEQATVHRPLRLYYHGGYTPGRGLESLILAAAAVEGMELAFRGFGPLEEKLRALATRPALRSRVRFLEPVAPERLPETGLEHDIGIIIAQPTSANGRFVIGSKLFEYTAAGLAVLCPRSHTLVPFMREHPIGMHFDPTRVESIAAVFRDCVLHPQRVLEWKQRSQVVGRQYNAETQGARLRRIVEECVSGSAAERMAA